MFPSCTNDQMISVFCSLYGALFHAAQVPNRSKQEFLRKSELGRARIRAILGKKRFSSLRYINVAGVKAADHTLIQQLGKYF